MKKHFFALLLLFISISSFYAIEIKDSNDNSREYFSLGDSIVNVIYDKNLTLEVRFEVNSNNQIREYNLSSCNSNKFCTQVDLLDLFDSNNSSTIIPNEFNFTIDSISKLVYLDVKKPQIEIISEVINATLNTLEVEFNYSDNSNSIKVVELYVKDGSSYKFDRELESEKFIYNLSNEDEVEYQLRVEDSAGNTNTISSEVIVGDIYEPIIEDFIFTLKDSTFNVEFTIKDENLERYAFTQNSISLEEAISGSSYTKVVTLPFTKGNVVFTVEDSEGNTVSKSFSLKDDISISSLKRYSKEEEFSLTSNAQECYLLSVDGRSDSSKFTKSGSSFKVDINAKRFEDVLVEFSCIKNGFRKYYSGEFFYDTQKPSEIELSLVENDEGEIELSWTKSLDEHLEVSYILYRDSDEIYEGSKTKYVDDDVKYGSNYEYYVEVVDQAGNKEESREIEATPKKTEVRFFPTTTNNQIVQDKKFTIKGALESDATLIVNVKHNNNLIDTKKVGGTGDGKFNLQVILESGLNTLEFLAQDLLGNEKKSYLYVTYEPVVVVEETPQDTSLSGGDVESIKPNDVIIEEVSEIQNEEIQKDNSYWFWLIIVLLLLALFLFIIFTKEDELREKFRRTKNDISHNYSRSRKEDLILGKNLEKAKQERIKKQEEAREKKRKLEELKNKKEESDYQKQKIKELSPKKEIFFSEMTRKKAQRRVNKIKKESSYEEELDKLKEDKSNDEPILKKLFSKTKVEEKKDELSEYIGDQKQRKSWDDTYSYRSSHIEKLKAQEDAKIREIAEQRKLEELKIQEEKTKKQLEEDKKRQEDDILSRQTSSKEFIEKSKERRVNLDEYLGKRVKKKRFFFAERAVEDDLKRRK